MIIILYSNSGDVVQKLDYQEVKNKKLFLSPFHSFVQFEVQMVKMKSK